MKTQKRTRGGLVTSSVLALALAVGLVPAQGLAFAAEAAGEAAAQINADQPLSQDASSSDAATAPEAAAPEEGTAQDAPAADDAAAPADAAEDAAANADTAPAARPQYTTSTQGHMSAMLPLAQQAEPAAGAIEYGGLAYTIDPENPDTAKVTGLATDKPKGDVQVQTQVASNGKVYAVTAIEFAGGGAI